MKPKLKISLICAFAALIVLAAAVMLSKFGKKAGPPIIVVLIDTLRADHMGFFGYERDTTPVLDAFARESLAFTKALSPAPWTPAAVASVFTGLYPVSHGFMPPNILWDNLAEIRKQGLGLSDDVKTLAQLLKGQGYVTSAVSSNPWIGPDFNFTRGFDLFRHIPRAVAGEVSKSAIATLQKMDISKPFFLYLHYLDPHEPYTPPERYKGLFNAPLKNGKSYNAEQLSDIALYDSEIRYADAAVGKFFEFLKQHGIYDRAAIVVLSDHGEQFGEHGNLGHGNQLFNEELHVPLYVKPPAGTNWRPAVIADLVSTIDVTPTLLDFAGLNEGNMPGVPLVENAAKSARLGVFSEIKRKYNQRAFTSSTTQSKLIIGSLREGDGNESDNPATNIVGLFDLRNDWYEQRPLTDPALLEGLQEDFFVTLKEARARAVKPRAAGQTTISDETMKQLESLGYMK